MRGNVHHAELYGASAARILAMRSINLYDEPVRTYTLLGPGVDPRWVLAWHLYETRLRVDLPPWQYLPSFEKGAYFNLAVELLRKNPSELSSCGWGAQLERKVQDCYVELVKRNLTWLLYT